MRIFDLIKNRSQIQQLLEYSATEQRERQQTVLDIIDAVRREGDTALLGFTRKFDGVSLNPEQLRLPKTRLRKSWEQLDKKNQRALQLAAKRIRVFHQQQKRKSWEYRDSLGVRLTQRILPLNTVGLYVPGGGAAYPSTVLMSAIPAKVAGVPRIVMVTPPPQVGDHNTATLAAAHLAGIDEVYQVGGAQAVAALAFGTATLPRVDKVVGPGNVYVALAKQLLYGRIDIDSIAGPSEILVICDKTANATFIAADLLSQAEHDPDAIALCIVIDAKKLARQIADEVRRQTKTATRRDIIQQSIERSGAIICVNTRRQAVELANQRAPEHLEIHTQHPRSLAKEITNVGSIFIGPWTPEAIGDYTAGVNHVLPTGGTARFFSALSVDDFVRSSNIVQCPRAALQQLGPTTITLAELEGLPAHADAIRIRLSKQEP